MKTSIIVQARMTSSRLPGKILKSVVGKPLLEHLIDRLRHVELADDICIATTKNSTDDVVEEFCRLHSVSCYRGSENDVLSRYYEAAITLKSDIIVRITSDCPLIDPVEVDRVIRRYHEPSSQIDYVSNTLERTYPRGLDTEVFSMSALSKANQLASSSDEREHVTLFMYKHPDLFRLGNVKSGIDYSQYRWTVDTPDDLKLIAAIYEALYPVKKDFSLQDIIALMRKNPKLEAINQHIKQNVVVE